MKILKKYWYHASLKEEESLFVRIGYSIMYAGMSLVSLFIIVQLIISIYKENLSLRHFPWNIAWVPIIIFLYGFSLFISIISQKRKGK
jgi:hypothetical protein